MAAIIGSEEITDASAFEDPWLEVADVPAGRVVGGCNVFGVPWVVGAKKGMPNFNEFHLQNSAQGTRYLRVAKSSPIDRTPVYQQSWVIGISNSLGAEIWNSDTQAFPFPLELRLTNRCAVSLTRAAIPAGAWVAAARDPPIAHPRTRP